MRFLVGDNRLIQLDRGGRRITGAFADHYVLIKVAGDAPIPAALTETQWILRELRGRPALPAAEPATQVFLQLRRG
jgi:copper homeostasis protein (lipoprotein)